MNREEARAQLRGQVRLWRAAEEALNDERARLNAKIIAAKNAGCSYENIREETGMGTATIQTIILKSEMGYGV